MGEGRREGVVLTSGELAECRRYRRENFMWSSRKEAYIHAGLSEEAADACSKELDCDFALLNLEKRVADRVRQEIIEREERDPGVPCVVNLDQQAGGIAVLRWPESVF